MDSEATNQAHQQLYDDRYQGNYMDTDDYSEWAKQGATALQVLDTLQQVPIKPKSILDFGCGVGGWVGLLSSMYREAKLTGVDVSTAAIEKAQARYPQSEFAVFDGALTPYEDKSFDLIFSFHVLEHVQNIDESIAEVCRLLKKGGYACIIFPCGNGNSLQEVLMRGMEGGVLQADGHRTVHFFEVPDGHIRRMRSDETIDIFQRNGLSLVQQWYSNQIFGWIDWLCRGTGPGYIKKMFRLKPKNFRSALYVIPMKHLMLRLNWLIRKRNFDLSVRRNPIKQLLVYVVKYLGYAADYSVRKSSELEWKYFRKKRNGTAQYLLFKRD